MSIKGQGHYLTLAKGHADSKIRTCFSQKLLCLLEPVFVRKLWVNELLLLNIYYYKPLLRCSSAKIAKTVPL